MRPWQLLVIGASVLAAGCSSPGGVSSGAASPPATAGQRTDTIRAIQTALAQQGYDPGVADGRYGAKTAVAIRRYQQDHSLPVDGQASPALLAALQGKAQAGGASAGSSSSSQSGEGSGLADLVNHTVQKVGEEMQKFGQGVSKTIDGALEQADDGAQKKVQQKVDQKMKKAGLASQDDQADAAAAGQAATAAGSAGDTAGAGSGASSDPCPHNLHKGGSISAECSIRKHSSQEHP